MSDDLRRVLKDPAHRLPDSLVDLDAVHAGARRVQRRHTGLAALGGAVMVVAISLAVVQPWSPTGPRPPVASPGPTPTVAPSDSPPPSPSPDPSPSAVSAGGTTLSVSAISEDVWWVLTGPRPCPTSSFCPFASFDLLRTQDAGRTFITASTSSAPGGIPPGTTTIRFLSSVDGFALVPSRASGANLWTTSDGGRTWTQAKHVPGIAALEAGGGMAWLLVKGGGRVGVQPLPGVGDSFVAAGPHWLGGSNGVAPALAVQAGSAVVLWYTDSASHLSVVSKTGAIEERVNPCTRDLGSGSVSATAGGLAVSCHTGTLDTAYASADGGRTWSALQSAQLGRLVVGSINGGLASVGGQDGRLVLWATDAPHPMVTRGAAGTGAWTWIGFTSETSGFAIDGAGQLFHTDQRGTSWTKVTFRR